MVAVVRRGLLTSIPDLLEQKRQRLAFLEAQLASAVGPTTLGLKKETDAARVQIKLLEFGYEPIIRASQPGWELGFVVDPRPFPNLPSFEALFVSLVLVCLGSFLFLNFWIALASATVFLASALLLYLVAANHNLRAIQKAVVRRSYGTNFHDILVLKVPLPKEVKAAFQLAQNRGLFDQIMVYAPAEVFESRRAYVDPLLIGIHDGLEYVISMFDLVPPGKKWRRRGK